MPWLDFGGSVGRGHKMGAGMGAIKRDWMGRPVGEGRYVYPAISSEREATLAAVLDAAARRLESAGLRGPRLMARQITVVVAGDTKGLTTAIEEASGHVGHFGGLMTGIAQGMGQSIFAAASSAVTGFVDQIKASGVIFREDQTSIALLGTALKDNVKSWDGQTAAIEADVKALAKHGFGAVESSRLAGQVGWRHAQRGRRYVGPGIS